METKPNNAPPTLPQLMIDRLSARVGQLESQIAFLEGSLYLEKEKTRLQQEQLEKYEKTAESTIQKVEKVASLTKELGKHNTVPEHLQVKA